MTVSPSGQVRQKFLLAGLLALILGFYLIEAHTRRIAFPSPATAGDQGAYLRYARQMHETNYGVIGDRNRMPVYPFLLSLLYQPGLTEAEFLARAQLFSINLSGAILLLLFLLYRRHFPACYCVALVVAAAFAVFIYRAPSARTELLYYFVSFCLFLSFGRMLVVSPGLPLAIWTGALAGLAHLTKASVLPALAIFTVAFALKVVREYQMTRTSRVEISRGAMLLALVLATFLAVIFPYIQTSKRVFGQYFYNVNSTFYMWCDSWPEARALTGSHGDRVGWPALPPEQIPSAGKYWREHSLAQIAGRLAHGGLKLSRHNARVDGYYKYVVILAGIAIVLGVRRWAQLRELVFARLPLAIFLGLFFTGYFMLYAWYVPLSADSRFLLALFLPFIFAASKLINRLANGGAIVFAGRRVSALSALAAVFFIFGAVDILHVGISTFIRQSRPARSEQQTRTPSELASSARYRVAMAALRHRPQIWTTNSMYWRSVTLLPPTARSRKT